MKPFFLRLTALLALLLLAVASCSVLRIEISVGPQIAGGAPNRTNMAPSAPPVAAGHTDDTSPPPPTGEGASSASSPADNPTPPNDAPAETGEATNSGMIYKVQPGDTLGGIAIAHGVSLATLMAANDIEDPDVIWIDQELVIPEADAATTAMWTMPAATPAPPDPPAEGVPNASRRRDNPIVDLQPAPRQVLLEPMLHDWQKMNNCAPTTVAMALSYYGQLLTQLDTAPALKGSDLDKNVSPPEIATYLHDQGFGGIVRVNGDIQIIQQLVSNNIPVIVEQWLDRPGEKLTGHYRLVRGYDQTTQEIIVNDSYSGPKLRFSYAEFDRLWRPFNRVYIPVYKLEQEPVVHTILGDDLDDSKMYLRAAQTAQAEINALNDAYAWFNLGNSFLGLGEYERAAGAFDQAIEIGLPSRMFWYQFGAFEAYNQTGQYQRVLDLSAPLTGLALEELHYQRGVAYEGLGQRVTALAEYQRAAELNPRLHKAAEAVARLKGSSSGS